MLINSTLVATVLLRLATSVVAQGVSPDFSPGRCSFDAVVTQDCWDNRANTFVDLSPICDGAGAQFMEQTDFIDLTDGLTLTGVVAGKKLKIGFERDSIGFIYGDAEWPNQNGDSEFSCTTKPWDNLPLDCNDSNRKHRSQALTCEFDCTKPESDFAVKRARSEQLPENLSTPPNSVAASSTSDNYAPGFCSFKLQLFQQCLHTPAEGWHNQMLGMLYSVEDNNRETAVIYPEGTGRIDKGGVRLMGMGGLIVVYSPQDRQTYFSFDPKGGYWSTLTTNTPDAKGICSWNPWTRGETGCDENHQNDHPRLSDMTCGFWC
ncbi:hypothetical protein BKA58DRAFT_454829 [Alternaria rosae]|uniref:uncharacterized protein n=1 Tax=Alternaria rosae TaxID=1187941 RepID=UPI001E8CDDE6|nr:uncharacterized protein BKA58DRAFT_454829 [Alternaria rosae]KAH6875800.1 hypothetical protein BKA58DRAFT_454829 [Alternaria rosae]